MSARVSVLLNSYIHRQFVWDALGSVVGQDSARPVDIVILSPDPRFEVPESLLRSAAERSHEVRVVRIPAGPAGLGLKSGGLAARGSLLAILDDDDLWEPGKLRWIESVAAQVPEVAFLHNSQTFVDRRNRPLSVLNPHRLVRHPSSLSRSGHEYTVDTRDGRSIERGMAFAPDFNNSSCVIDRSTLLDSPVLERVPRGEDSFLFYTALLTGRPMALTSDRLTRYRLHRAASTTGQSPVAPGSGILPGYVAYVDDHIEVMRQILGHLPSGALDETREWLAHEVAFWSILRGIATGQMRDMGGAARIRELLGTGRVRLRSREIYVGLLGVSGIAAPVLTLASFRAWRLAW